MSFGVPNSEQNRGVHVETLADKAELSRIRKHIRSELKAVGAPPGPAFDCLVAVTEACTNALVHGAGAPGTRPPELTWAIEKRCARFRIRDYASLEGPGGAPRDDDGDWPRDGGYGLPMMRRMMDTVDITFSPNGTIVSMEKRF